MSLTIPRAVLPTAAAEAACVDLARAGWTVREDASIELAWEPLPDRVQVILAPTRARALAAVEAGATDALVWPQERERLHQTLIVAHRVASERAVRLAYTQAFRANPDWNEITDCDAVLMDVSEGFVAHSGYARHEAIGRTPAQLFRAGTHGRAFYSSISAALDQRGEWEGDLVGRRRNGSWAILEARIGVVRDGDRAIAHFASKRVPAAASTTSLRARLAATTTAPWVLIAPGGLIVDHSPHASEVLDQPRLLGTHAEALGLHGPGDVWMDGPRGLRAWEVRQERLTAGDIELVLLVLHDVTDRKRHAEELDALAHDLALARDQALAGDQAKSAFLMSMSHELRTPLNAILGYGELLLEAAGCSTEAQADLQRILSAGRHLLTLVDDVLDLARVEAGKVFVHDDALDVVALLTEAAEGVRLRAAARGQRVEVRGDGGVVRSDRRLLHQILLNLLGNAVKYAVPGTIVVGVEWDDVPTLFVEDEGPGLDESEIQRVFQPFVQLAPHSAGVGLGLAISRHLAAALGGELFADSAPGRGSRFGLRLPAASRGA
jgi:PAS domain S-box-containing protein